MPGMQFYNLDSNEQMFFKRQLEYVKTELYEKRYPNLKARELIPVSMSAPLGAKTITYRMYDKVGFAKIVANYATDFPKVTVTAKEETAKVKRLGDSFSYTVDDIQAAIMANLNLETRLAMAAQRGIMELENRIAWFGDTAAGLGGFLTNSNIPEAVAPNGGAGSPLWANKTPDEIIKDVSVLINTVITQSNGVEQANTVLFPVTAYSYLSTTPRSANTDTTILAFLKSVFRQITRWDWLNELETAGTGGTRLAVAYNRDPMNLTLEIPEDFNVYPAQERGLEFEVPCSSKTAGVIVYYPLTANKMYGF